MTSWFYEIMNIIFIFSKIVQSRMSSSEVRRLPNNCSSYAESWRRNPAFGAAQVRLSLSQRKACSRDQWRCSIRKPSVNTELRLRPRLQCTSTRPPGEPGEPLRAAAIKREASGSAWRRSCWASSLSRSRKYLRTLGKASEISAVALTTCVICRFLIMR